MNRKPRLPLLRARIHGLLRGEASLALLGVLGGALTGLGGSLLVARLLSPSERGHYATIGVFTMLALACLQMGGELGVLRGITEANDGGVSFVSGYLRWTFLCSGSVGVIMGALGSLAASPWLHPLWLVPLCATMAVYSGLVARVTAGILVSSGRLHRLIVARAVANIGTVAGCLMCMPLGLTSAFEVATFSFIAQAVLNSLLFVQAKPATVSLFACLTGWRRGNETWHRNMALVWRRGNVHLHVLSGTTYMVQRSDQMALSALGADKTLGIYAVATNVSEVVNYLPAALSPLVSRGRPGHPVELGKILLVVAACVGAFTPVAYFALPLLYGEAYREAQPAVLLLVPATGVVAVGQLFQGVELRDTGRRRSLAMIALAAAAIEFAAMFSFGGTGVVAAALACATGYTVFTVWIVLSCTTKSPRGQRPVAVPAAHAVRAGETTD